MIKEIIMDKSLAKNEGQEDNNKTLTVCEATEPAVTV